MTRRSGHTVVGYGDLPREIYKNDLAERGHTSTSHETVRARPARARISRCPRPGPGNRSGTMPHADELP